jgi:hypothetical protein
LWKCRQATNGEKSTGSSLKQRKDGAEGKKRHQQTNYKASTEGFHQIRVVIHPV